jgi:hypothetical protein
MQACTHSQLTGIRTANLVKVKVSLKLRITSGIVEQEPNKNWHKNVMRLQIAGMIASCLDLGAREKPDSPLIVCRSNDRIPELLRNVTGITSAIPCAA